ncbi:hypothetical protein [Stenotrophomonas sp.]|uniref:hypothetical protein n=1 Tax=Stenotrophomonas sp. TaxID=69392 RepID=UPI0028A6DA9A|nr:hypothetical protein [Stenotrophomonas sp.]
MKAKPEEVSRKLGEAGPFVAWVLTHLQQNAWWLSPVLLVAAVAMKGAKKFLGEPEVWKELQRVIDDIRSDVYGTQSGSYHHHHRVTLYEYRRRWLYWIPWSFWLMPFVRSGHTSKSNVRCFRVHPKSPGCLNGFAGKAWESEGAIHVEQLPSLTTSSTADEYSRYAEDTNMAVAALKKKLSSSRSYWAVRVMVKGEPWGVLVLDSVSDTLSKRKADGAFKQYARVFSLLLPRV